MEQMDNLIIYYCYIEAKLGVGRVTLGLRMARKQYTEPHCFMDFQDEFIEYAREMYGPNASVNFQVREEYYYDPITKEKVYNLNL